MTPKRDPRIDAALRRERRIIAFKVAQVAAAVLVATAIATLWLWWRGPHCYATGGVRVCRSVLRYHRNQGLIQDSVCGCSKEEKP